jgi:hypothetical protein
VRSYDAACNWFVPCRDNGPLGVKVFFVEFFFMYPQPRFQTYYQLSQVVKHTHFIMEISKVGEKKAVSAFLCFEEGAIHL